MTPKPPIHAAPALPQEPEKKDEKTIVILNPSHRPRSWK